MNSSTQWKSKVDVAIVTIKPEEFRAVLDRFSDRRTVAGTRNYELATLESISGDIYTVAITRTLEQGQLEAQKVTQALIDDLDPRHIFLVGIAGGVPKPEFSLGDVVLATRVNAFVLSAVSPGGETAYQVTGGSMTEEVKSVLSHLDAWSDTRMAGWNTARSVRCLRPELDTPQTTSDPRLYGPEEWRQDVIRSLRRNHEEVRSPRFLAAPGATSNQLIKNVALVQQWQESARQLTAIEMELEGVWTAARQKVKEYPVFSVRGVSDIVGFRREPEWTDYACHTAAAFAYYLIRAGILPRINASAAVSELPVNESSDRQGLPAAFTRAVAGDTATLQLGRLSNVPVLPPHYIRRNAALEKLRTLIVSEIPEGHDRSGMRQGYGIVGMGGIGKTILAISIVRDEEVRRRFTDGIFWLTVGPTPQIEARQMELLEMLTSSTPAYDADQEGLTNRLRRTLATLNCLIVLDDVWNVHHAGILAPVGDNSRLLLTTRSSDVVHGMGVACHQLEFLMPDESLALLSAASGTTLSELPKCASAISAAVGHLPLALSMIGTGLRGKPASRWVQNLERLRSGELDRIRTAFPDYPYPSLLLALQFSIEALPDDIADRYYALSVFPSDWQLPETLLERYWTAESPLPNSNVGRDYIDLLVSNSLLRRDGHGCVYLHALQKEFIRHQARERLPDLYISLGRAILSLTTVSDDLSCLAFLWEIQNNRTEYPFAVRCAAVNAQRAIHIKHEVPPDSLSLPADVTERFFVPLLMADKLEEKQSILERYREDALHPSIEINLAHFSSQYQAREDDPHRRAFFNYHLNLIRDLRLYGSAKAVEMAREFGGEIVRLDELPKQSSSEPSSSSDKSDTSASDKGDTIPGMILPDSLPLPTREALQELLRIFDSCESMSDLGTQLGTAIEDRKELLADSTLQQLTTSVDEGCSELFRSLTVILQGCKAYGIESTMNTLERLTSYEHGGEDRANLVETVRRFIESDLAGKRAWFSENALLLATGVVDGAFDYLIDSERLRGDRVAACQLALSRVTYCTAKVIGPDRAVKQVEVATAAIQELVDALVKYTEGSLDKTLQMVTTRHPQVWSTPECRALLELNKERYVADGWKNGVMLFDYIISMMPPVNPSSQDSETQ